MNDASDMIYNKCIRCINYKFHCELLSPILNFDFTDLVNNHLYVTISLMMGNLKIR